MNQPISKSPRIEAVDALRGFAVMAILLVHNVEHFIYPVYPTDSPAWLGLLDEGVFRATFALFAGKAYAIFALLFGFTFYIQYNSQRKRGKDFGYRFLWRLVLLAGFATLNAVFFPGGDVLLLYALVAPVLFITRRWSDRAVLITSVVFLLQPVEWFHCIARLVNPDYLLPDWGVGALYGEVAEATKSGNWWDFIVCNATVGQKASLLWAVNAGRYAQTAGLFLLGFYLGRKELFVSTAKNLRFWTNALIVSAVLFAPLEALKGVLAESAYASAQMAGTVFDMWQKLAFTVVLVASFMLLYQKAWFVRRTSSLRFYGRMSLTNYLSQSLLGALVYFPVGLHLAPYCGYTLSLLIGFGMLILQVLFCRWWLSRHKQGPLESLWHKWTWMF